MSGAESLGMVCGIIVGIILVMILLKFANRDGKMKTDYDERQSIIRGRGYQYGFFAILIYEAVMVMILTMEVKLPLTSSLIHFIAILIGVLVQAGYCIWKGAYWGLNNNVKRYGIIFVAVGLINFLAAVKCYIEDGSMLVNGKLSPYTMNFLCGVMFIVLGCEVFIKKFMDMKEDGE